jgi:hypothetical protein
MSPAARKGAGSKGSGETQPCPWCSATVPREAATCPSCGAQLREAAEGDIPGVTQTDLAAVSRARRSKPRGLAAWLVGEPPAEDDLGGKIEPPSEEVRKEMLRLELAALDAELEARAQTAAAERAVSAGEPAAAEPDAPEPDKAEPG